MDEPRSPYARVWENPEKQNSEEQHPPDGAEKSFGGFRRAVAVTQNESLNLRPGGTIHLGA